MEPLGLPKIGSPHFPVSSIPIPRLEPPGLESAYRAREPGHPQGVAIFSQAIKCRRRCRPAMMDTVRASGNPAGNACRAVWMASTAFRTIKRTNPSLNSLFCGLKAPGVRVPKLAPGPNNYIQSTADHQGSTATGQREPPVHEVTLSPCVCQNSMGVIIGYGSANARTSLSRVMR